MELTKTVYVKDFSPDQKKAIQPFFEHSDEVILYKVGAFYYRYQKDVDAGDGQDYDTMDMEVIKGLDSWLISQGARRGEKVLMVW